MAQIAPQNPGWGTIIGEGLGQGTVATLQRLIDEKARKIDEKHQYERNLKFLKGAGYKNAEQLAHGSESQLTQLLKSGGSSGSASPAGNSQYDQLKQQYSDMGQQQGDQELEQVLQGEPTPEGYENPKVQQALMQYIQSPQAQQEYTPEQLQKAQQKIQSYAQKSQQPSPTQQLMGQAPQQSAQGGLSPQDKLYDQLLNVVPNKFEYDVLKERRALRQGITGNPALDEKKRLNQERHIEKLKAQDKTFIDKQHVRDTAADVILQKGGKVLDLLTKPDSDVAEGAYGEYVPLWFQSEDSRRVDTLTDDIAAELTALQSGQQTISKIRFNKGRKPSLNMDRNTQIEKTYDLLEDAAAIKLETDITDYIIDQYPGSYPENLKHDVRKLYNKLDNHIPKVEEGMQQGDGFEDPKTGALWQVEGPIMRFRGFAKGK